MLHAVIMKKSLKLLKEYDNIRIPREDIITSTIFGPLCYFQDEDIYFFITSIAGIKTNLSDDVNLNVKAKIDFWPSKKHTFKGENRTTEPDIVFEFNVNGKNEIYIFELKWGTYSFGEDQIEREWKAFKIPKEKGASYLVYLANRIDTFNSEKASPDKNWKGLTWLNFLEKIRKIKPQVNNKKLKRYLNDLISFLNCFDFRLFKSFTSLNLKIDSSFKNTYQYQIIKSDKSSIRNNFNVNDEK
ncbi:hypothetical protein GQ597_11095 [Gilliamella sp. Pra-s65]|uniref:hypothetical protein n=1 Tax=unclassified Gilliamella TaxID=2685620 RepID=UPI001365F113|nr:MULTISPECIES: hypothetical protein [unclassified Gilliamella]MWN91245.1 hypothetical protein [Gilliamella sp. Pra-s65]MWP47882.1 hypothetical protein [Gilliamella sp. Pas-s27]MWP74213.1 hypothetical protein [Gilliamella sp. Pra-s52]